VKENVLEIRLRNLLEEDLRKNDDWVQESRGKRRNHFIGDEKLRNARNPGVAQTLFESRNQIRARRPGVIAQAAETQVTAHNSDK
jgi:hypothetical protein